MNTFMRAVDEKIMPKMGIIAINIQLTQQNWTTIIINQLNVLNNDAATVSSTVSNCCRTNWVGSYIARNPVQM